MVEPKEVPESKVSLKYMAWNIKEMSADIKKIANLFEVFVNSKGHAPENDQNWP